MDLDLLKRELAAAPAVVAAWLFGSRARGTARPTSDVDVAVLLGDAPEPAELAWDLEARLSPALRLPVQVVPVDRAPADLVRRVSRLESDRREERFAEHTLQIGSPTPSSRACDAWSGSGMCSSTNTRA